MKYVYTGIDIIEIDRIAESIKDENFLKKIFTEKEMALCTRKNKAEFYAGRFAAKEAVSKAVGTGIRGFSVLDIEILNDELGKPYVILHNKLRQKMEGYAIQISLSHSREYAVSTVIVYKNKGGRK